MSLVLSRHLTCKEIVELVTSYIEGGLDEAEMARFESHLTSCGSCVTYVDQMQQMIRALGALFGEHAGPSFTQAHVGVRHQALGVIEIGANGLGQAAAE